MSAPVPPLAAFPEPEHPASVLKRAAELMRKRAEEATPGPWERPLDVRNKAVVIAARPDDEEPRQYRDGIIPAEFASHKGPTGRYAGQRERVGVVQCNTWSDGSHDRKRNGRDLEYVAAMHPLVGLAVAAWLDSATRDAEEIGADPSAVAVARAYLGDPPGGGTG